jgi:glycosyltransferase involved in cell wall biosynthesis
MSERPLRVLQVTQYLDIGGLETVIIELCRRLDRSRFEVEVLCLNGIDPDYIQSLTVERIPVHLFLKDSRIDFSYFFRVAHFIRKGKFDVLHAHSGCFFYAMIFARLARIKLVLTAHGLPVEKGMKGRIEEKLALRGCQALVPVSEEIGKVFVQRVPRVQSKIRINVNGIDVDRFLPCNEQGFKAVIADRYRLPANRFMVGSVGRLEPVKNYAMLLRAFARLEMEPDLLPAHLIFVGTGSLQKDLEKMTENLNLSERVSFLGMQYRVQEILPLLDVFVLSSFTEGTSISLLEAQACGVPAVVTDVGGNGYVVRHGENGFLCKVNDDEAMAAALRKLRDAPSLEENMGMAARRRILEVFGLDSMVRRYEKIYHDIASTDLRK